MTADLDKPMQGLARVWFRYLQMAITANESISWDRYEGWGSPEELATVSFARWWKERGARLFTPVPKLVKVLGSTKSDISVSIPIGLSREQTFIQLRQILSEHAPKGSRVRSLAFAPTGRVNIAALIRYQWMLEIDLNPKSAGIAFVKKVQALQQKYEKNKKRLDKQRETVVAKGGRMKIKPAKIEKIKGKERATKNLYESPDIRVAHRWLAQGRIVMRNVARGAFPGSGYYQRKGKPSLGKVLREK